MGKLLRLSFVVLLFGNCIFAERYSRAIEFPAFTWSHGFRVTPPLQSGPVPTLPTSASNGFFTKNFEVFVSNLSDSTQNIRVTATLSRFNWVQTGGIFLNAAFGTLSLPGNSNTIGREYIETKTVTLNPAGSASGASQSVEFNIYHFGPITDPLVYAHGSMRFRVEVQEANGAVVASANEFSVCNGGCMNVSDSQNLLAAISVQTPRSSSFRNGLPF